MAQLVTNLVLPFLGQRTYLHGTTLFDALLPLAAPKRELSYVFSHLVKTDRVAVYRLSAVERLAESPSVTLTYSTDAGPEVLGVVPLAASPEPGRVPYDEKLVTDPARFDDRQVEFDAPSPFSFVATVVPLNKALLQREVKGQGPGQWFFTRMDLARPVRETRPLTLKVQGVLGGGRIAKTKIDVAGSRAGVIYFSWANQN
jgi:hypothetical protein